MSTRGRRYVGALHTEKKGGRDHSIVSWARTRNKRGKRKKGEGGKKKLRTPCPTPRTRVPGEISRGLECTPAPHARIRRPRADGMDVQVERERAHAAQQLVAPASRTSQEPVRARTVQHRERSLFPLATAALEKMRKRTSNHTGARTIRRTASSSSSVIEGRRRTCGGVSARVGRRCRTAGRTMLSVS